MHTYKHIYVYICIYILVADSCGLSENSTVKSVRHSKISIINVIVHS